MFGALVSAAGVSTLRSARMSTTDSDNSFWQRYTSFGQDAASLCSG